MHEGISWPLQSRGLWFVCNLLDKMFSCRHTFTSAVKRSMIFMYEFDKMFSWKWMKLNWITANTFLENFLRTHSTGWVRWCSSPGRREKDSQIQWPIQHPPFHSSWFWDYGPMGTINPKICQGTWEVAIWVYWGAEVNWISEAEALNCYPTGKCSGCQGYCSWGWDIFGTFSSSLWEINIEQALIWF